MKLMKRAAVHIITSQVRHCAVTPKIIINFGRTLSEHVAQLKFGNKPEKAYAVFIRLQTAAYNQGQSRATYIFFLSLSKGLDQGLKDSGHMWPARAFCAGRNAFWEFSDD